jgi:nitrite reductase/ring-hydroxylating ferredoxin subunit
MSTETKIRPVIKRGLGSEDRPVARTLWDRDSRPTARSLSEHGNREPDNQQVNYKRYYDEGYFKLELEKLWLKSWLFACREEDIPKIGDRVPLEVGPLSFFIVRSNEDEFHAFYNSCLHRGTALCAKLESSGSIRCPYHGWEWNNDGSLKFIPSHWDFMSMTRANGSLREVKVARWGGFVCINAPSMFQYMRQARRTLAFSAGRPFVDRFDYATQSICLNLSIDILCWQCR